MRSSSASKELEALRAEQRKTAENEARLKREIESIGDDRRKFNQQIIDTASRVVSVEERIAKTQERLAPLDDSEQAMRASLDQRRGVIAEVLAALQRIGRQAPPALMIRAEDALQSVRSAMMLGAVLPEMRHQAETLAADLAELVRLRKQIAEERERSRPRSPRARRRPPAPVAADRGTPEAPGGSGAGSHRGAPARGATGPPGREPQST